MDPFDYRKILAYSKKRSMTFAEFIEQATQAPEQYLRTSSSLISEAIQYFGYRIVVRSGEPAISYRIFEDPFSTGINAVFGQEYCIKQIVNVIESIGKESGPNRGIVLVGPPASGKTNIVDLIGLALEEYTKQNHVRLYSFYFQFGRDGGSTLELRSPFMHNPILLFPTILAQGDTITHPRQEFLHYMREKRQDKGTPFPTYYRHASLDRHSLDILQALLENPCNTGKHLSDILDEYVRVEEIEFSNAQGRGIANIDDLHDMPVTITPLSLGEFQSVLSDFLPGMNLSTYQGAIVCANRGLLHVHDAFAGDNDSTGPKQEVCKPLLMLLGSGKASVESTQVSIDTTVIITTNIEEIQLLERQFTSTKLLDRIEKIPVNYLLDANSEMDILRRDLANMRDKYDVDPNLLRIAAYYAVLTRLMPPKGNKLPPSWPEPKRALFAKITPEQKLFIYAAQADDPVVTIQKLPFWHPFRNEAIKLGINIFAPDKYREKIECRKDRVTLELCGLFSNDQLKLIDDEFMRLLWNEHYPYEGMHGISVRQLQNIMRNTIANSDGSKIHVGIFLSQLKKVFVEGPSVHHWLTARKNFQEDREKIVGRKIGDINFTTGEADYGAFEGLSKIVRTLYYQIIKEEITVATVDRDPEEIEVDLRCYLQHALLTKASTNQAFAHLMIPKFTYVDTKTGNTVDKPDETFMTSIEDILVPNQNHKKFREDIAQRFLNLRDSNELVLQPGASVISSREDNFLVCFGAEFNRLLSHRKTVEGLDPNQLRHALISKRNAPDDYLKFDLEICKMVEIILGNMCKRHHYSEHIALDTIIFAIRKDIVNFSILIS